MGTADFAEVSRTAHQLALDHGHGAHLYAAELSREAGAAAGRQDEAEFGCCFSNIDPTVSKLTRTGTAFKSGRYLIPPSGRSSLVRRGRTRSDEQDCL
jgi:hypothetical protein